MRKSDIRNRYRHLRAALSPAAVESLEKGLLRQSRSFDAGLPGVVHRYMPAPGRREPDPGPILQGWLRRNPSLREVAPRLVPGTPTFRSLFVGPNTRWVDNEWGIPEPADGEEADPQTPDLVIVPLLSFDKAGHRVGYGKGYYDRFLAQCRSDCLRVGLSWFEPVDAIDDVHPQDIRLHCCITPYSIHAFP